MPLVIETERLLLRPIEPGDCDDFIAMMSEADFARFLTPDGKPQDREAAWRSFATLLGHWSMRSFGFFTVLDKSTGEMVGRVGPWMPEGWPALECGWGIVPRHWGKGFAPEAAEAAIAWIFAEKPRLSRIISLIDPRNANSQAVARKIGEAKTGEVFELWGMTLDIWAADREAWLARFTSAPPRRKNTG